MNATRTLLLAATLIGAVICAVPSNAQTFPALPQSYVDTSYPAMTGTTIPVSSGGDFQGALNQAKLGDTITLQAGATYSGTFTLPAKSGSGWIIIRTSASDSSLPAQGQRIQPSYASVLPKIVATSSSPAIQTAAGAHHYRLVGLEITVASGLSSNYGLVALGDGSSSSLSQVPSNLIVDRVYIHGVSNNNLRRGVALNSATSAVIDSYISDVHEAGADAQAICGWNGPGPYKIVNNYLSGAGENVLFGGGDPAIANLVPSDIEVRGNHVQKLTAWQGSSWTVKNIFELKNAQRVLVDGNIFEYNWPAAQNGFSILFTVRNQSGGAPWSVVQDVTFTHNIVRHVAAAVNILGNDDIYQSQQTKRILIKDNLFVDVNAVNWGGNGRLFQILNGAANVTIDHNTAFQTGEVIAAAAAANTGFTYRNIISPNNQYGVAGDGYYGNPLGTLATYFPGAVFLKNILQGGDSSKYPLNNFFPATMNDVGFVSYSGGDYRLSSTSPYKNAGTDGRDVGADIDSVNAATATVLSGNSSPPPPADTTPPTVSITAPANGATVSGTTTVTANASDNVGVVGVQFFVDGSPLGAEDLAGPYSISWNTLNATNGLHTLTAAARDAAGNRTTSAAVTVTVANLPDTTPPTVAITSPANGATVSGVTTISPTASDNVGVVGVQFFVDGSKLGAEDTIAPYAVSWDTTKVANGSHTLTAVARDAAGNSTTSAVVSVTVSNAPAVQSPYYGTPFAVPGSFQAEDFDKGGEGVAYHDMTAGNQGGFYRNSEDVDIINPYFGGYVVNNFQTGEWLEYTINVSQSGTYRIEALVSSEFTTSLFHVEIDGTDKTGSLAVPNTGLWGTFQWVGKDGISLSAGQHVLRITSDMQYFNLDALRVSLSAALADTTPPTVSITAPSSGATVNGSVQVTASASDNVGVVGVQFYLDGSALGAEGTASPFAVSWNTSTTSNGAHTLTAKARDAAGNNTTSAGVTVTVANTVADTTPPTVSITAPSNGATVNGSVQATASASDNVGVVGVQFYMDGSALGAEVTASPFAVSWNTSTTSNGAHTLTAKARDAAGNNTTSAGVTVTVANTVADTTPPTVSITAPSNGATVNGSVQATASASDNVGVVGVQFYMDGSALGAEVTASPFAVSWNTSTTSNGAHTLTAKARDAAGNNTTSAGVTVTVANTVADTTPPTVSITAPSNGATVNGSVQVTASASDNVVVMGVQFYMDGSALGAEVTASPFAVSWNTNATSNGAHTLSAKARDAAGNNTTSAGVTLTVANTVADTTPPTVSITAPSNGATVNGSVQVTASASDNLVVMGVQFYMDGSALGAEVTASPFAVSWNTNTKSNGAHTLSAKARDAAANSTTSAVVSVTVSNAPAVQSPFYGTPFQIPGSFEAEDFDRGGEGLAYHDLTAGNQGGFYRTSEDVDIIKYAGGYVVNNFQTGEWLEYTINVSQSGTYRIEALVSSEFTTSLFHVEIDGTDKTGSLAVPNTGFWRTFQWVGKDGISLSAGQHILRITSDMQYFNLDALRVSAPTALADTTPPTVSITAPSFGATVNGSVQVTASASDDVGVVGVQFYLDGSALGAEVTASPFAVSWDTNTTSNGAHTLTAKARDAGGNNTTSSDVTVTVANTITVTDTTPPTVSITAPSSDATVNGSVQVTASASDDVGVVGVQFYLDGSPLGAEVTAPPFAVSWNTYTTSNGAHTFTATAGDAAGNNTTSAGVTVTVANTVADTTPPTVWITAPISGATVNGSVQVTASASDNLAVMGVQFYLDGSPLGAEITASPFAVSWSTSTASNGSHTLTAKARDAAGNSSTCTPVSAMVSNSSSSPGEAPYKGTPFQVPGRFEAEDFDIGGEGVAYHDLTPRNQGGYYRTKEDVDIINPSAFRFVVNNFQTGEWLNYMINVSQPGTYRIEALVSSQVTTSRFHVEIDGTNLTGSLNVPNTGSWGTFQWVGMSGIVLPAGQHVLKIYADAEYFNIDAISTSLETASSTVKRRRALP